MFFVFRVKMEDIGLERLCEFYSGKGSGWREYGKEGEDDSERKFLGGVRMWLK